MNKSISEMLTVIIKSHVDQYFDGDPNPKNIKLIEDYFNNFLFSSHRATGLTFSIALSSRKKGHIKIEDFQAYMNGRPMEMPGK